MIIKKLRPALIVLACALLVLGSSTAAVIAQKQSALARATAAAPKVSMVASSPAQLTAVKNVDLHDGTVIKVGSTYYLYGTMYGCGFHWLATNTPWCGFGVSTATSLAGPWTTPTLLFSPNSVDPFTGTTWNAECGSTGRGCFNPRMIQRNWGPKDGTYILWFNAPADYARNGANAYYAMGCNGPLGQCGNGAGGNGTTRKPPMNICAGNGDFSIVPNGSSTPYMVCTNADQTLSEEQLDYWGTSGTGVGSSHLAGLNNVEAPGAYQDAATGKWILTYSDVNCGYCGGDGTGYATASSIGGPWTAPANYGFSAPGTGRRDISATSCGGQPRTIFTVDNQPYQLVDLWGQWNGDSTNQAGAGLAFITLSYAPQAAPNGGVLPPQFAQWPCM
ncbi:MAG TPA: hypothetical protein VLG11_05670 [Candidatus Saccharimonadales bacterium]|nr:hypothetical protein [Candidatus Saccharimonadales bacterium]